MKLRALFATPMRPLWAAALFLGVFILFTRIVYHLPYLYSWDGVQYALSIQDFDIHKHQPHPPGNPLYSLTIWLFTLLTGEANRAMISLSIIATLAGCFFVGAAAWFAAENYAVSKRHWIAIGAAALFSSNPILWFYGCVAEVYAIESLFVSLFVYLAFRSHERPSNIYWISLVMGIAGGFRPSTEMFLLPAYFALHIRKDVRTLPSLMCMFAANLIWLIPLILMSDGPTAYFSAVLNHGQRLSVDLPNEEFVHERIVLLMIQTLTIPALLAVVLRVSKIRLSQTEILLLVVVLPMFLFVFFVHFPKEGYWLFMIPPFAILMALIVAKLYSSERAVAGILAAAFLFNCYIFIKPPVYTFDEQAYEPLKRLHFEFTSPNRRTLRDYRVRMNQFISKVSEFRQGETGIVIEKGQFPNWRLVMYYFPEDLAILVMDNKRVYLARERSFTEFRGEAPLDKKVKVLVIASATPPVLPSRVGQFSVYQYTYYYSRVKSLPKQFRLSGIRFNRDTAQRARR